MQITTRFIRILVMVGVAAAGLFWSYRDTAIGGIQGSGFRLYSTIGRITGFGSIFVDGVEYPTSQARISINDRPGTESQLRIGQIITIKGRLNPDGSIGEATNVTFFGDAYGPITQADKTTDTFIVLGQTVRVIAQTLFGDGIHPASLAGLLPGTWVEVSAWPDATGKLLASRIDLKASSPVLQLRGSVAGLDPVAKTFQINALTVHYADAAVEGVLANAAVVQLQGTATSTDGSALWANRVRVLPDAMIPTSPTSPASAAYDRGKPRGVIRN